MRNLSGKRILITGGGGGLGRALAQTFANAGATILITDVDVAAIRDAVNMLRKAGGTAHGYCMDVTDYGAVCDVRDCLHRQHGPIDVLINNAGIVHGGTFLDVPWKLHQQTYQINVLGVMNVTYAFLPDLIASSESHLVNIASAAGLLPLPYAVTYSASKWAVIGLTESIHEELRLLGHSHVGTTTVCPSFIRTELFAGARPPLFCRTLTPQHVAHLVFKAVKRNRTSVKTPWLVKIVPWGKTLPLPWLGCLCDLLGVTKSMLCWCGNGRPHPTDSRDVQGDTDSPSVQTEKTEAA